MISSVDTGDDNASDERYMNRLAEQVSPRILEMIMQVMNGTWMDW